MIRQYKADDADIVLSIWLETSKFAHPFLDDAFLDMAGNMIRNVFLDMAETWIVESNGSPVGFISVIGDEIGGLFLRPAYHGRGLGRALMDKVMEQRTAVELDVFSANQIGLQFYTSYGFAKGLERVDDLSGHPVIRMTYSKP